MLLLFGFMLFFPLSPVQDRDRTDSLKGDRIEVDTYETIVILDATENTLSLYSKDLDLRKNIGGPGWENGQFDRPAGIWARNGIDVFVADYGNHRIQRFDRSLSFVSSFSTREDPNPDLRFGYPTDIALSRLGDLFVCDGENARLAKVNRFTRVERTFGGFDAGRGRLQNPIGVEVGPKDQVFVLDGPRIVVFDNFGNYVNTLGDGLIKSPEQLVADQEGILVLDSGVLHCFDGDLRLVYSLALDEVERLADRKVRSISASRGVLYFLTNSGLVTIPDPRHDERQRKLDK